MTSYFTRIEYVHIVIWLKAFSNQIKIILFKLFVIWKPLIIICKPWHLNICQWSHEIIFDFTKGGKYFDRIIASFTAPTHISDSDICQEIFEYLLILFSESQNTVSIEFGLWIPTVFKVDTVLRAFVIVENWHYLRVIVVFKANPVKLQLFRMIYQLDSTPNILLE